MAYSILVIDDNADLRALVAAALKEEGYVVHQARNGRAALQVLDRIALPDVILLDYRMSVMGGPQFLASKQRDPRLRGVPVIVLSAWTREWTGSRLDIVEVLSKPVDLDRLLPLVRRVCTHAPVAAVPSSGRAHQSSDTAAS